jgi:hypothetical protein
MKICPWEAITDYRSAIEFDQFVQWMDEQLRVGVAEEVSVQKPYIGATTFREKWFRHIESGQLWRLVWPDGPFTGLFEQVGR